MVTIKIQEGFGQEFARHRSSFSVHRAALMTKIVHFCFRCKFSFQRGVMLESGLTVAWFSWTNHNSFLRIVTNEISSFCIDNRLRQMFFFVFSTVGVGKGRLLRVMLKDFWNKKSFICSSLFRYYIKQIDSMLPCICSVIDHRRRQN